MRCRKYYLVMVLPSLRRHPHCMLKTNLLRVDRELTPRRSAMPAALGGVAVLAMSLLLTVGPTLGAANNDNNGNGGAGGTGSSNVKVHDASSGLEALGNDNESHVCDFWLEFSMPSPYEAGTWALESWPPTGDGSTVASGTYNTTGDGTDASSVIHVIAGHYRVEWAATGATVTKKKTLWVDAGCYDTSTPAETPAETPAGEPAVSPVQSPAGQSPAEQSPADGPTSPAEEPTSPAEEPATPAEDSPAEQPASPADDSAGDSPAEEPTSPTEESFDEGIPPVEEPPAPTDEQDVLSDTGFGNESSAEDPAPPADESPSTPTDESSAEEPAQAEDPGADVGTTPVQDQLDSQNNPGGSTMPDTAASTLPAPGGLVATLGLLVLIAGHAATRRSRRPDRD
ncbi:MAG: hypothetical protein ACXWNI_01410 [Candidatus Limnocylindrales bacterium]